MFLCVSCSLGRIPQDSAGTSCRRQPVQLRRVLLPLSTLRELRLQSLLAAALRECLVASSCLLGVWVWFGTLRSYFLPLKREMGGQRIEHAAVEPSQSRHSHSVWCRTEWSAWKLSTSDPPGSTFVLGPVTFAQS